jgi:hypothetical protein
MLEGYVTLMKPVGDNVPHSRDQTRVVEPAPGELPRWTFALKVVDSVRTSLAPSTLFDLMADPQGCLTWHAHPKGTSVSSVDAPQGLALAGAEVRVRGQIGKFPLTTRTVVIRADWARLYETASEVLFDHPRLPTVLTTERYVIEPDGEGSIVRYETEMSRDWSKGTPLYRLMCKVTDRFFAESQTQRCFRDFIASAERHASAYTNSH